MANDDRPRPQYGEYASPEEQAKAMARFQPDQGRPPQEHPHRKGPQSAAPDPVTSGPVTSGPAAAGPAAAGPAASGDEPVAGTHRPGGTINRVSTIFLLALGIVYLIGGAASFVALPQTLNLAYRQWGIGDYVATPLASTVGIVIVLAQAVIWVVVAAVSLRRLKVNQSAWWIPIIGAVATVIVTVILMAVVIGTDPVFATYVSSV